MNGHRTALLAVLFATILVVPAAAVPVTATGMPTAGAGASEAAPGVFQAAECEFPVEYTDATGTSVRIEDDPDRVITMGPSAAQTMWEIGGKDEVVGVTQFASYLEGAEEKANISAPGYGNYDVERMVALEPDLVIAPNIIGNETVEQLRSTGLTVVKMEKATTIESVRRKTTLIGQLTGHCEGAAETNRWMDQNLQAVSDAVEGRERVETVYVFGTYTSGDQTFIHDMIEAGGGRNVMAQAGVTGYRPVNKEVVAEQDPSVIVTNSPDSGILQQAPYNQTTAGQEGNVVAINPNYINQPAPRSVVYAVRNLTEAFHGEAYGEADYVTRSEAAATPTTTTTTATTEDTTTTTVSDGETTTTEASGDDPTTEVNAENQGGSGGDSQSTPGFGIPAAALALLAVVTLLARRRD